VADELVADESAAFRHAWRLRLAFWSALACLALPVAAVLIINRLFIRRRPMAGLWAKLTGAVAPMPPGGVLVHGVSLGEVNLMRPLVPGLESIFGARCLLTTSTTTGWEGLAKAFPDHARAFFPLDLPWAVGRFLSRTRPRAVVLLESELWPVWLCACHARGIPVIGVNVRVSGRTHDRLAKVAALVRPFFRARALSLAQNGTYAARLLALGARRDRVLVSGSMKADMVRLPAPEAVVAWTAQVNLAAGQPLLLAASTSEGEERVLFAGGFAAWTARGWQMAICPRHPERGAEIADLVRTLGGTPHRTSQGERLPAKQDGSDVLIVDEIGRLGLLYAHAARTNGIAVVGGSLGSGRGGQNMLEAAAAGCATVVGWDVKSQPDPMALLRLAGGVEELTPANVEGALSTLASDPDRRRRLGEAGRRAWRAGQGATERVLAAIDQRFRFRR
jgi:3-deoxy-D-manno-octulosonic-acid transferase